MKEPTEPKDFESRILQIMDSNIRLIQVILCESILNYYLFICLFS